MKNKRIKVQLPSLQTRDEAEAAMRDLAAAANVQRMAIAERDAIILETNKAFEGRLSALSTELNRLTDALRVWAETNPDQFPKGRKSIEFVSGVLGFRTGTPKLALLSRAWNWQKVLEAAKLICPAFVRIVREVDREAILAARAHETVKAFLPGIGLKVVQDESFFIEPALTDTDARQTQPAEAA